MFPRKDSLLFGSPSLILFILLSSPLFSQIFCFVHLCRSGASFDSQPPANIFRKVPRSETPRQALRRAGTRTQHTHSCAPHPKGGQSSEARKRPFAVELYTFFLRGGKEVAGTINRSKVAPPPFIFARGRCQFAAKSALSSRVSNRGQTAAPLF